MTNEELILRYGKAGLEHTRIDLTGIADGAQRLAILMERFGRNVREVDLALRELGKKLDTDAKS